MASTGHVRKADYRQGVAGGRGLATITPRARFTLDGGPSVGCVRQSAFSDSTTRAFFGGSSTDSTPRKKAGHSRHTGMCAISGQGNALSPAYRHRFPAPERQSLRGKAGGGGVLREKGGSGWRAESPRAPRVLAQGMRAPLSWERAGASPRGTPPLARVPLKKSGAKKSWPSTIGVTL